jgi:hypothetical protein
MPVKTPVKKTARTKSLQNAQKPVKKAVRKTAKKATWDEIQAGFKELHELQKKTQKTQDEAWAAIRETQQAHKETEKAMRETEKALKKAQDESWKAIRETQQAVKETQKNIGGLGNTLGSIVEHLLTPGLPQKFKKLGYSFNRIATYKFAEGVYAQIDGMLENGERAVAVEVKTPLRQTDIDDHLARMEKIRKYADEYGDKRQFMGAMAATIADGSSREYALKNGLFVIEPSGDDVKVTMPEGEVRVW